MQYLIDGYNLFFRFAKKIDPLQTKRLQFIRALNDAIAASSLNVVLIFDGSDSSLAYPARQHFDALEIIYTTKGLSADLFILETLHAAMHPENYTVVTNDRDLAYSCKVLQAKTKSIEHFLESLLKKKRKKVLKKESRDSDAEIKRLLVIFEKRISEEL